MKKEKTLENLLILSAAALAAYLIFKKNWLLTVSFCFLILGVSGGRPAYWISYGWDKFAVLIGRVNSRIILTLLFYLFLTPAAFLFRLFNRQAAGDFTDKTRKTQFKDRSGIFSRESFEKPW